jgi:Fe2+ transport system protein FeoA
MTLIDAPKGKTLKIVNIDGGDGVRRKLMALGFHKDDLVELNSQAILRGPVIVRNLSSDARVALGRGVAQKIVVSIADEPA